MIVIPAIDLLDQKVVRLSQGKLGKTVVYSDAPLDVAQKWIQAGAKRIHIVDLNGAFEGRPRHSDIVNQLAFRFPEVKFEVGGGIRNQNDLDWCHATLAHYFILGTAAVNDPDFVTQACRHYPKRIILGLDARDGLVATEGWDKISRIKAVDLIDKFKKEKIESVIYTDIAKDGMMQGMNLKEIKKIAESSPFPVIASGGVQSLDDIKVLKQIPNVFGVIIGKALYEGTVDLGEAIKITK